jgi:hypothetical protein
MDGLYAKSHLERVESDRVTCVSLTIQAPVTAARAKRCGRREISMRRYRALIVPGILSKLHCLLKSRLL